MGIVTRPRIIRKKQSQEHIIEQIIMKVEPTQVKVMSRNGKTYNVKLSDRVKIRNIEEKDTAIIDTNKWLVIDIKKRIKPIELTREEKQLQLEKEMREFEDLFEPY